MPLASRKVEQEVASFPYHLVDKDGKARSWLETWRWWVGRSWICFIQNQRKTRWYCQYPIKFTMNISDIYIYYSGCIAVVLTSILKSQPTSWSMISPPHYWTGVVHFLKRGIHSWPWIWGCEICSYGWFTTSIHYPRLMLKVNPWTINTKHRQREVVLNSLVLSPLSFFYEHIQTLQKRYCSAMDSCCLFGCCNWKKVCWICHIDRQLLDSCEQPFSKLTWPMALENTYVQWEIIFKWFMFPGSSPKIKLPNGMWTWEGWYSPT